MKRTFVAALVVFAVSLVHAAPAGDRTFLGFSDARAGEQRKLEAQFDSKLQKENLKAWMKQLTARPHHLGSAAGKKNAEFIAALFRSWGYDTSIETFDVLFPTPKTRLLEMTAPQKFVASLAEPSLREDSTSSISEELLPTFNAYSVDGDVRGPLVYVNYGIPKDYEELERRGIDVKGKIVISRYGGSWRGIKPKVAAEHGAIGCIIYSDPRDDGYFQGDVYPKGSFRNELGAQRGSVADMPQFSGDPLTPGVGATKDATRLAIKDAPTLTKIPVLPISYGDALPLLRALGGPVAPESWRGALPITYHIGPGPAIVHLKVAFDWKLVPAHNVIAKMKGATRPDEWIIRGNHHDAWNFGADDPISGMVALMEEARAIGELAKQGWRPRRTLVYAAWDGEEQGLLGSTEWAEAHGEELKRKAVAYINSDSNGRGFLYAAGSHTLERLMNQVARDVKDPQKGVSVGERSKALKIVQGTTEDRADARNRADQRIGALGSGSDFTPFLQHLGIAALNIGFGGEDSGGSYHSIYDSFDYYSRFGDPKFEYGVTLARVGGRIVLRLSEADVLPFEFTNFAETVGKYVREVEKLADTMRDETVELNRQITDKSLEAWRDPTEKYVAPKAKEPVPHLNFAPLENAAATLKDAADRYDTAVRDREGKPLSENGRRDLDAILMTMERSLTSAQGLPGRPWYKHQIYAPGMYTGYGVKTLPAVREAIELRRWTEAEQQVGLVSKIIEGFAREIDRATALVQSDAGS